MADKKQPTFPDKKDIGKLFKKIRNAHDPKITQQGVADAIDGTANWVSQVEAGRSMPAVKKFKDFSRAYQVNEALTPILMKSVTPDHWEQALAVIKVFVDMGVLQPGKGLAKRGGHCPDIEKQLDEVVYKMYVGFESLIEKGEIGKKKRG